MNWEEIISDVNDDTKRALALDGLKSRIDALEAECAALRENNEKLAEVNAKLALRVTETLRGEDENIEPEEETPEKALSDLVNDLKGE